MAGYGYAPLSYGLGSDSAQTTNIYPAVKPVAPKAAVAPLSSRLGSDSAQTTNPPAAPTKAVPYPAAPPVSAAKPAQAAAAPPATLYDYNTDPILQQVQAQTVQQTADAEAGALAARKQLAIQYGDPSIVGDDAATAQAAAQNPYSVYGMLAAQQPKDQLALDESLNKGNLFYSGARINQQHDLLDQYGATRAQKASEEQSALQGIDSNRLAAILAANNSLNGARGDAYNRLLQQILANPVAYDTGAGAAPPAAATPAPALNGYAGQPAQTTDPWASGYLGSALLPSAAQFAQLPAGKGQAAPKARPALKNAAQVSRNSY